MRNDGGWVYWMAEGAIKAGLRKVLTADDADQAALVLERELAPGVGDLLLVKGSRGMELERVVEALGAAPQAAPSVPGGGGGW